MATHWHVALYAIPLIVSAVPDRTVLYNRVVVPPTWHQVGRASQHQRMHFSIAVQQTNLDQLEERFWAVSDPRSPDWQKFMTRDEIGAMVASKPDDMVTVRKWLATVLGSDSSVQQTADAIEVHASVAEVERLFETKLFVFSHDRGRSVIRTMGEHSIPTNIHSSVDLVEGLSDFPMYRNPVLKLPQGKPAVGITAMVSPQSLQEMYSIPRDTPLSKVSQGAAEFQNDTSFNKTDLETFFTQMHQPQETVSDIVGPYDGNDPDIEATLDVQYLAAVGVNQTNWYWTSDNWMYQWAHTFFNATHVPDAVSISWGWAEDQQCGADIAQPECKTLGINSEQYVKRVNTEFQKIGLRGVSLFVASGDSGANGRSDSECTGKVLHASFPGSSPYVTAVGATMLKDPRFELKAPPQPCSSQGKKFACASGGTEVAVSSQEAGFTSGGGFSTYSEMPSYQKVAVNSYLSSGTALPPSSYFKRGNRAFPDVSAMGNNFLIYADAFGGWSTVGGTSASSPTFAGVAAYLNDVSYKAKGKPLGFLNPLLYQMHEAAPDTFTDVTIGDNKCTESGCFARCKGYMAAKGWDPVTGLGTPVADKMIAYVKTLLQNPHSSEVFV